VIEQESNALDRSNVPPEEAEFEDVIGAPRGAIGLLRELNRDRDELQRRRAQLANLKYGLQRALDAIKDIEKQEYTEYYAVFKLAMDHVDTEAGESSGVPGVLRGGDVARRSKQDEGSEARS